MLYNYHGGLDQVWDGKGELINGPLMPTLTCRPSLPGYSQNLTEAKAPRSHRQATNT